MRLWNAVLPNCEAGGPGTHGCSHSVLTGQHDREKPSHAVLSFLKVDSLAN
jgi:hypothetical protein